MVARRELEVGAEAGRAGAEAVAKLVVQVVTAAFAGVVVGQVVLAGVGQPPVADRIALAGGIDQPEGVWREVDGGGEARQRLGGEGRLGRRLCLGGSAGGGGGVFPVLVAGFGG